LSRFWRAFEISGGGGLNPHPLLLGTPLFWIIDCFGALSTPQGAKGHTFARMLLLSASLNSRPSSHTSAVASDIGVMVLGAKPHN